MHQEWSKWEDKSKKYWLTIKDIEKLKKGINRFYHYEMYRIFHMILIKKKKKYDLQDLKKVFKSEKDTYVYHGDLNVISKVYNDKDTEPWGLI